jgi:hypothetical protein
MVLPNLFEMNLWGISDVETHERTIKVYNLILTFYKH